MASIFGDDEEQRTQSLGLLGLLMGGGILAGNQPGASMGQALGQGLNQGVTGLMQMQGQRSNQELRALQMQKIKSEMAKEKGQQDALSQLFGGTDAKGIMDDAQREAKLAQAFPDAYAKAKLDVMFPKSNTVLPAAPIQNFAQRQALVKQYGADSNEVKVFDNYVRSLPFYNTGGEITQPPLSGAGLPPNVIQKTIPLEDRPDARGAQTTATEQAKVDVERGKNQSKAKTALSQFETQAELVTSTIDKALKNISPWSTGYGTLLSRLPETQARALQNDLDTIKANIGFDRLQQMRDASPTGGALGNVSEMENKLLQAVNGALDPGQSAQLKENLTTIKQLYGQVLEERREAYDSDYNKAPGGANPAKPLPAAKNEASAPEQFKPGSKPEHNKTYTLPDGSTATWDSMKQKFISK
jgi:hypothetical protein